MTIKKFTVAAALAIGITTCSVNSVMAACPCQQKLPTMTTPSCNCAKELPTVTGKACPCETPAPKCANPASALCPGKAKLDKSDMRQIYAYPNAIYGNNNYIGHDDFISRSEGYGFSVAPRGLAETTNGVTVATDKNITGAASNLPCLNEINSHNGIPVMRDECKMDNNCTPIQMETQNSIQAIKKSFLPLDMSSMTGAASGIDDAINMFRDVPEAYWAACDITKLAMNDVVVGYPDRTFKPGRHISRAEFATMLVKGFNKESACDSSAFFKDVPSNHWAGSMISKAVNENLMKGYPNNLFKPQNSVTRVEAICAMSKALNCQLDECKAKEVLSKYCDGNKIPEWAQVPIATALDQGVLKNTNNPNRIDPFKDASRADVASMLQVTRLAGGYDKNPQTANNCCPPEKEDKQAFVQNDEIVKIPTLKLEFKDQINAKSSHVGERFAAKTLEDVTINGQLYPCGSKVIGKVVEVIRPSGCQKGALKLAFTQIENCGCKATLPKQVLTAQIDKSNTPNIVSRIVASPLTWAGSMIGIVGRTTGGMLSNLGNAAEDISGGLGVALGESFQGQFGAAGRGLADFTVNTIKAPIDVTRTALSGTLGLVQSTGDEVAYMVDARGYKISAINPKEHVTIAFGCQE